MKITIKKIIEEEVDVDVIYSKSGTCLRRVDTINNHIILLTNEENLKEIQVKTNVSTRELKEEITLTLEGIFDTKISPNTFWNTYFKLMDNTINPLITLKF